MNSQPTNTKTTMRKVRLLAVALLAAAGLGFGGSFAARAVSANFLTCLGYMVTDPALHSSECLSDGSRVPGSLSSLSLPVSEGLKPTASN